ncbi:MAG: aconitase family protein, partial [Clostridia bacterium]
MVNVYKEEMYYYNGKLLTSAQFQPIVRNLNACEQKKTCLDADILRGETLKHRTISYSILSSHNVSGNDKSLMIKFDAMASHDITYVGIIQSARASGMTKFPLPYVLTNCHNSLCAVGGTINEDDHVFGLSAAKKYGGIYVPANIAVIHSFMREMFASPKKMILGSDSHTRY